MRLILRHPDWSSDDLLVELSALNFEIPTRFLVSCVKLTFKANLKFLKQVGVIDADARPRAPLHPDLIRRPRKSQPKNPPYKHYYGGKDDG